MIDINRVIYNQLSGSTELAKLINTEKIFVLHIPETDENGNEITTPIIQFGRFINPSYSKSYVLNNTNIILNIYTQTYAEGVKIAKEVRKTLEFMNGSDGDVTINNCLITSIKEDYTGNEYVQTINLKIT